MAYRKIHDSFWTDPDMEELTPEQKFFYIYLITNPSVNQIGLYEFSAKRACFETGYNTDTIYKLLEYFEGIEKIKRSEKSRELLVVKFYHHNKSNSPKVQSHVNKLLEDVKDKSLIQYIYGMYTASQEEEVQEEEKEEAQTQEEESPAKKNGSDFLPPNLDQVLKYASVHAIAEKTAKEFFWHYDGTGWEDKHGRPIKNWTSWLNKWQSRQPQFEKPDRYGKSKPDANKIKAQFDRIAKSAQGEGL